jgi:hypothetical protein
MGSEDSMGSGANSGSWFPTELILPPGPACPGPARPAAAARSGAVGLQRTAARAITVAVGNGGAEREMPSGRGGSEWLSG